MRNSDVLARLAAVLMVVSGLWNGLVAFLLILSLIWILVGVMWFVPLLLAGFEILLAIAFLITGHNKGVAVGPLLGLFVSVCNFNVIGITLDVIGLGLMIASYVARANEDRELEAAYA